MAETPNITLLSTASAICRSCGLCCSGALFLCVTLPPNEVRGARNCGLDVRESPTITGFPLPCSQHLDQRCAVYDNPGRPRVCRTYQCWLLHRYLNGRVSAKSARRMVRLANRFHARVASRIGAKAAGFIRSAKRVVTLKGGPSATVSASEWARVEGYMANVDGARDESGRVSSELVRDIFKAGGFLRRHFVWPEAARNRAVRSASMDHDGTAPSDDPVTIAPTALGELRPQGDARA